MKKGFTLVEIMIVVAIIGLLAAIAIPSFMRARTTSQKNACINNLRQIEVAKDQYALEQGLTNGSTVTFANIGPEVAGGSDYIKAWPVCPAGPNAEATTKTQGMAESDYTINVVGANAACRVYPSTHLLP